MRALALVLVTGLLAGLPWEAAAQGPPPAKVAVAGVEEGRLAPLKAFKGTVYFKEVAQLATEVEGRVIEVLFEDGDRLAAGTPMVRLDHALISAELANRQAVYEQTRAELSLEQARLARAKELLDDEVTTPQEYDNLRFTVEAMRHRVSAARAAMERIALEIERKTIAAPFDGVVVLRQIEVGEWLDGGDTVAVFASNTLHDIVVNVPEQHLPWIRAGAAIEVLVFDRVLEGEVIAGVPRGDAATRTFPIKVRVTGEDWLLEGMSAEVRLPAGEVRPALLVPRDAVLVVGPDKVLFTVEDGAAARHVIEVLGYADGGKAGISPDALPASAQVVVKGQERLRHGQPVLVLAPGDVASAS